MRAPLHITNGDATVAGLRRARPGESVLAWADVLHEGPVPAGLSLAEMTRVRARFLASEYALEFEQVFADMASRDAGLRSFKHHSEIVLWFEHDLYDQLQLLQLLHWLSRRPAGGTGWSLICIRDFPGFEGFRGLGQLDPGQLESLYPARRPVSRQQLELASRGWSAFCAATPGPLVALTRDDLAALPFLHAAIVRHLEQYPSTRDGLARSERQILQCLESGPDRVGRLFRRSQIEAEQAPFMGDWTFAAHLLGLARGAEPLVEPDARAGEAERFDAPPYGEAFWNRGVRLTEAGRRVAAGQVDRTRFQKIDRWLGGVRLSGDVPEWRWDPLTRTIVRQRG